MLAELAATSPAAISWAGDLEEALRTLGYREQDQKSVLQEVYARADELKSFEAALKFSLQRLTSLSANHAVRGHA